MLTVPRGFRDVIRSSVWVMWRLAAARCPSSGEAIRTTPSRRPMRATEKISWWCMIVSSIRVNPGDEWLSVNVIPCWWVGFSCIQYWQISFQWPRELDDQSFRHSNECVGGAVRYSNCIANGKESEMKSFQFKRTAHSKMRSIVLITYGSFPPSMSDLFLYVVSKGFTAAASGQLVVSRALLNGRQKLRIMPGKENWRQEHSYMAKGPERAR